MSPILVGTDGSEAAEAAVEWAAYEAMRRGVGLSVLHASAWYGEAAEQVLASAQLRAWRCAPHVEVSGSIVDTDPGSGLIRHAATADMVVVGNKGHGRLVGQLVGSVALQVAGQARCPVMLVPLGAHHPQVDLIVVGVGVDSAEVPLRTAFDEAVIHDARLHAVHGWSPPMAFSPGVPVPVQPTSRELRQSVEAGIRSMVAQWSEKYPSVRVTVQVATDYPRNALLAAAQDADLVVVGAHERDGWHLLALGSVTGSVIHHSRCPVLIARGQSGHGRQGVD